MPTDKLLPIKLVIARSDDYYANDPAKGSAFAPFVPITPALRKEVASEVDEVESYFDSAFREWQDVPGVARVQLRAGAFAKSYRPVRLFNTRTCPLFGGNRLGELFSSVTSDGLAELRSRVLHDDKDIAKAHLSTIQKVEPYRAADALGGCKPAELSEFSANNPIRIRLFRHNATSLNREIDAALLTVAKKLSLKHLTELDYPAGLRVLELRESSPEAISLLASFPGVQSISQFPEYGIVRTVSHNLGGLTSRVLPAPEAGVEYPLVGVIDSGTDVANDLLQQWVEDRWELVPSDLQDNTHGSFVTGLICNSRALNRDDRFPDASCRVVDVVAFDQDGTISERQLLYVVRDAVARYPDVKVWNLSFSLQGAPCRDHQFSPLAMLLDELSHKYGIVFVNAAGNFDGTIPLGRWPRTDDDQDRDRICSPADSPTSLVVGSIAHRDGPATCVKQEEPSPFTRRGPGAGLLVSPHVVHYGGNCADDGDFTQTGVVSVGGSGQLAELVGTSFSTPIVASILARVQAEVSEEPHSAVLAKALVLHSALLANAPLSPQHLNYTGVGRPPTVDEIIHCRQDSATLILQCDLGDEPNVAKETFPMPSCLIDGGTLRCEVLMTLLYIPPFDAGAGFEYCQTNINASLGTIDSKNGNLTTQIPTYLRRATEGFEPELIKNGYKWSPYKCYYRSFEAKNKLGEKEWRLRLSLQKRAQFRRVLGNHTAFLLITLRDTKADGSPPAQIYNEFVREMTKLGWGANDLRIRSRPSARS